jgi:hypothetical protein
MGVLYFLLHRPQRSGAGCDIMSVANRNRRNVAGVLCMRLLAAFRQLIKIRANIAFVYFHQLISKYIFVIAKGHRGFK